MRPSFFQSAALLISIAISSLAFSRVQTPPANQDSAPAKPEPIVSLGTNANSVLNESSGLANSTHVAHAYWTHNDSGNPAAVYLLQTDGLLLADIEMLDSKNFDFEAMAQFNLEGRSYLAIGDVGDNSQGRKHCQIYLMREPNVAKYLSPDQPTPKLPLRGAMKTVRLNFTYEDGPRDCEAIGVDVDGKKIWLVEKIFFSFNRKSTPGIYTLPLTLEQPAEPLVAKRLMDFPILHVTGMAFSPDGRRLIIRNYANAHLYNRADDQTWEDVVKQTKPVSVVLPIQRQGEAICFTPDSKSVIVTSEYVKQPIWQTNVEKYFPSSQVEKKSP